MKRGRLIVLEGGEGGGKTTQARVVARWLRKRGRRVVQTREPGGTPLAEGIRGLVLKRWREGMDGTTELLLMFAARAAHLNGRIRPALEEGRDVICDRFVDASYAYQGAGRGVSRQEIDALVRIVLKDLRPDLVLLLDVAPGTGAGRVRKRGTANRFDRERERFQKAVRAAYLARARRDRRRYAIIDASQPRQQVSADIERILEEKL